MLAGCAAPSGTTSPASDAPVAATEVRLVMKISRHPVSLDRPVGESEDSYFGDFIEDEAQSAPADAPREPRVVVVGGGYAGATIARELDAVADVTVVEPKDHFVHAVATLRVLEQELSLLRSRCDGVQAQCQVIDALHARAEAQDWAPQRNAPAHRHV